MSYRGQGQKGKFKKGKNKRGGGGGSSGIGNGNFDEVMKGFVIMTDRDREKNAVVDANNFLIPLIEEIYPHLQYDADCFECQLPDKKIKTNDEDGENVNEDDQDSQNNDDDENENQGEEEGEGEQNENKEGEQKEQQPIQQDVQQKPVKQVQKTEEQIRLEKEKEREAVEQYLEQEQIRIKELVDANQKLILDMKNTNELLEKELKILKSEKDKILYNVKTDVKCTVFLKINSKLMPHINATSVVENIMEKVHIHKQPLTRFCHRMYPAEFAFRADEANLRKYMKQLIQERIPNEAPSSWMLECKSRNNSKFNRKNILDIVNTLMPTIHFVDYKNPFYTVVVDICHNLMCICVLKNYNEYKKYSVKVNPQLNNVKDYSFLQLNKPAPKVIIPVTEEQLKEMEQKQEEQKAQLRAELIGQEEDEVDLI